MKTTIKKYVISAFIVFIVFLVSCVFLFKSNITNFIIKKFGVNVTETQQTEKYKQVEKKDEAKITEDDKIFINNLIKTHIYNNSNMGKLKDINYNFLEYDSMQYDSNNRKIACYNSKQTFNLQDTQIVNCDEFTKANLLRGQVNIYVVNENDIKLSNKFEISTNGAIRTTVSWKGEHYIYIRDKNGDYIEYKINIDFKDIAIIVRLNQEGNWKIVDIPDAETNIAQYFGTWRGNTEPIYPKELIPTGKKITKG